jgi:hypothetical protein
MPFNSGGMKSGHVQIAHGREDGVAALSTNFSTRTTSQRPLRLSAACRVSFAFVWKVPDPSRKSREARDAENRTTGPAVLKETSGSSAGNPEGASRPQNHALSGHRSHLQWEGFPAMSGYPVVPLQADGLTRYSAAICNRRAASENR